MQQDYLENQDAKIWQVYHVKQQCLPMWKPLTWDVNSIPISVYTNPQEGGWAQERIMHSTTERQQQAKNNGPSHTSKCPATQGSVLSLFIVLTLNGKNKNFN